MTTPTILKSFEKLYADNAQGIEIERLKMQVEALTAGRDALRADAEKWQTIATKAMQHGGETDMGLHSWKCMVSEFEEARSAS